MVAYLCVVPVIGRRGQRSEEGTCLDGKPPHLDGKPAIKTGNLPHPRPPGRWPRSRPPRPRTGRQPPKKKPSGVEFFFFGCLPISSSCGRPTSRILCEPARKSFMVPPPLCSRLAIVGIYPAKKHWKRASKAFRPMHLSIFSSIVHSIREVYH